MPKPYSKWIDFLYGPFFRVIGFFYRSYTANRARVARITANENVARALRLLAVVILLGWILIWYFAPQGDPIDLVDEIRQSINPESEQAQ